MRQYSLSLLCSVLISTPIKLHADAFGNPSLGNPSFAGNTVTVIITSVSIPSGSNNYIQNTAAIQTGATFNVASGTVQGNFTASTITVNNSALYNQVAAYNSQGILISTTVSAIAVLPLPGGATNYIQNSSSLQSGATFFVSSGTVQTQLNIGSPNAPFVQYNSNNITPFDSGITPTAEGQLTFTKVSSAGSPKGFRFDNSTTNSWVAGFDTISASPVSKIRSTLIVSSATTITNGLTVDSMTVTSSATFSNSSTFIGSTTFNGGTNVFVDRGDPAVADFSSFTNDVAYHDLDLSSIIPAGKATAVVLIVHCKSTAAGDVFQLRRKGNSNTLNQTFMNTAVANQDFFQDGIVPVDVNGKIQYIENFAGTPTISVTVKGWWQ